MSLNATQAAAAQAGVLFSSFQKAPIAFPFYHVNREEVIRGIPDKYSSLFAPFATYWIVSLAFHFIDQSGWALFEQYRIHEPDEVKRKNRVTVRQVLVAVFAQQAIQTVLGLWWLGDEDPAFGPFRDHGADLDKYAGWVAQAAIAVLGKDGGRAVVKHCGASVASWMYWWGVPIAQFFLAAFILDTWQYFWHRYFHENLFLYRKVHSWHHRLYVPYAFGALYNHPLEGFILDTLGSVLAESGAGMTTRQAMLFFALSTWKTVDDHCGFALPWDPVQHLFGNNADYHDIHHQIGGLKKNYSQPYFIHFDLLFGTRMTRAEFLARKSDRQAKSTTSPPSTPLLVGKGKKSADGPTSKLEKEE
ncbi:hypothetical protein RQP46_007499 [Phenoliferia psychrophenolica]